MQSDKIISLMTDARWFDLTQAMSIFTPPWPGEMPLQIQFFKRLTGSFIGGQGANGQLIEWSNNTGTHLVGPRSEEHTSELQSLVKLVCRLLLEKKNQ